MRAMVTLTVLFAVFVIAIGYATRADKVDERTQRLIKERDELAAESLRSFRAHEKLQQIIPEYRPAQKPAPGQRDA